MVLRKVAVTTVCFLTHRITAFVPRASRIAQGALNGCHSMLQEREDQQQRHRGTTSIDASMVTADGAAEVFALDFDGVICNSVGESSRSGFKALKTFWPEVVAKLHAQQGSSDEENAPTWFVNKMKELRPVVETGYENLLLGRLLIEEILGLSSVRDQMEHVLVRFYLEPEMNRLHRYPDISSAK